VGDQLTCVFVDHGLMRKNEGNQVVAAFRDEFKVPLIAVDAEERFLGRLAGVTDPERKRKIIGEDFIRVFEEQAKKLGNPRYLVQGTLYSDVIESGGGTGAATIKSHHNVGGLPEDLEFELVEPLRMLFKDEVRQVGAELGLPDKLVWRQPFPGPGLAIRVVGGEVADDQHGQQDDHRAVERGDVPLPAVVRAVEPTDAGHVEPDGDEANRQSDAGSDALRDADQRQEPREDHVRERAPDRGDDDRRAEHPSRVVGDRCGAVWIGRHRRHRGGGPIAPRPGMDLTGSGH
jgi:hypothetical protein